MKFKVMKRILEDGTTVENVVAMHNTAHKCGVYKQQNGKKKGWNLGNGGTDIQKLSF